MGLEGGGLRAAHLNLVDSSRHLFELDPGAKVDATAGRLLAAGSAAHPMISNAAFRTDDGLDPSDFLAQARAFFAERGRGYAVWARGGVPEDDGLIEAATATGLEVAYAMPEMTLGERVEEREAPAGAEIHRVATAADASDYWRVATSAYASLGFPPEIFAFYENHEGLRADNVAAFLARLDGEPVSIAMTIVNHGVAGIYWVGSTEQARGRGLGEAMTAAAVNAGFDRGGEIASLQASPMGEPIYRRMGFETVFSYELLLSPPPDTSSQQNT
jgi:ribosomal protein S18 acetylase RimI-like enzyme